jgi:hypothetical protein
VRVGRVVALVVLVALLTGGLVYFLSVERDEFPPGTQSVPYRFSVAADPGVDTGTDIFRLGQVAPGGKSWRALSLARAELPFAEPSESAQRYAIVARGPGSAWIYPEPNVVTLPADVNISLMPPLDAEYGTYEGMLYVVPYGAQSSK